MADDYKRTEIDPDAKKVMVRRNWEDWLDGRTLDSSDWEISAVGSTPVSPLPLVSEKTNNDTRTSAVVDPPFHPGGIYLLTNHVAADPGGEENDSSVAIFVTEL